MLHVSMCRAIRPDMRQQSFFHGQVLARAPLRARTRSRSRLVSSMARSFPAVAASIGNRRARRHQAVESAGLAATGAGAGGVRPAVTAINRWVGGFQFKIGSQILRRRNRWIARILREPVSNVRARHPRQFLSILRARRNSRPHSAAGCRAR